MDKLSYLHNPEDLDDIVTLYNCAEATIKTWKYKDITWVVEWRRVTFEQKLILTLSHHNFGWRDGCKSFESWNLYPAESNWVLPSMSSDY